MRHSILFILLMSLGLFACKKNDTNNTTPVNPILFQKDYINYAWGFIHSGWFIDSEGKYYQYYLQEEDDWAQIQNGQIMADSLHMNFGNATEMLQLDLSEVSYFHDLSMQIMNDTLSLPETIMADAGIETHYAFKYQSACDCYKSVIIKKYGDITQTNTGEYADTIYNWMKNLLITL